MDRDEMRRRVSGASVARLATTNEDGSPHLVPVVYALDGERLYTPIDHKQKRTTDLRRMRNIARDERVAVLVDHYDEDWSALWWVRLDGRARVVDAPDEGARAIELLTERYSEYRERPLDGPIIAVEIDRWVGWIATP